MQDGGNLDADGAADGQIRLVGGPRDSFWGYALGTLFIRFFGIFFVLSLLMIGMFASGWIFTLLDRIRGCKAVDPAAAAPPACRPQPWPRLSRHRFPNTVVAAIAAALYLRDNAIRTADIPEHSIRRTPARPGPCRGASGSCRTGWRYFAMWGEQENNISGPIRNNSKRI